MGDEDEWCELIYSEALRLHKTALLHKDFLTI